MQRDLTRSLDDEAMERLGGLLDREFLDAFQDKLMFGTDSCKRSDINSTWKSVAFIRELRTARKLSDCAMEKLKWRNAAYLLKLNVSRGKATCNSG